MLLYVSPSVPQTNFGFGAPTASAREALKNKDMWILENLIIRRSNFYIVYIIDLDGIRLNIILDTNQNIKSN